MQSVAGSRLDRPHASSTLVVNQICEIKALERKQSDIIPTVLQFKRYQGEYSSMRVFKHKKSLHLMLVRIDVLEATQLALQTNNNELSKSVQSKQCHLDLPAETQAKNGNVLLRSCWGLDG
jgi:hypothetical protein